MLDVNLVRDPTDDQGTRGALSAPELGFACLTLELPWRANKNGISCITAGSYTASVLFSSHWKRSVIWLNNVPGRSVIQCHPGNLAGDAALGFETQVRGCILVGESFGLLGAQRALLASGSTFEKLMANIAGRPMRWNISWRLGHP